MNGHPIQSGSDSKAASALPSTAAPPFNKAFADTVLRTSDGVDFHVWRGVLIEASPVLSDMFALGGESSTTSKPEAESSISSACHATTGAATVIPFPELSTVLDPLLRTCYPPPHPTFPSLDSLKPVLAAAHKYQMEGVQELLTKELLQHARTAPLRVYVVAVRFDMQHAAEVAARHFLGLKVADDYVPELEDLSAGSYHRLLAYRKRCTQTLADMISSRLSWLPERQPLWQFLACRCSREEFTVTLQGSADVQYNVAVWFWQHYRRIGVLLAERPCRAALDDPKLNDRAVMEGSECGSCRARVHDDLHAFTAYLLEEIDRRLAAIPLPTA
ncbi:hypothetical protein K466DRAFT_667047 [Polyporus arcularius HHB13444]|uniref:BTB domain-containing protein n=1 Tax=Polyporus arcularius HHB13444 TaxID=1314778 RepID=A0A5C3NXR2_9APHY|nr:hypothetical protein K466DRAFT_667047 [Polyporus arcularius HHB13444]